jgi:hypothetical protein
MLLAAPAINIIARMTQRLVWASMVAIDPMTAVSNPRPAVHMTRGPTRE